MVVCVCGGCNIRRGCFWGVALSLGWNGWWGDGEEGVRGAVRRSWGKRP